MKRIFTILISGLLINTLFANPIDEQTALKVAEKFNQSITGNNGKARILKSPVFKCISKIKTTSLSSNAGAYYYVFSSGNNDFTIVSGDDATLPILGYSTSSNFDPNNIPPNVAKWLEGYKNEIRYIIENNIQPTTEISEKWKVLKSKNTVNKLSNAEAIVNPLIQTKWDQMPYYNDLCPGGSVTGCVATAMAQIMKYWNYPATGSGFHSYNHQTYGTLSANFGSTTFQWTSMPNVVSSSNTAVATLMYQVGVSVDMNYSPISSTAKNISAQSEGKNSAEYALKTYFGYKNTLQGIERENYKTQWLNILKNEFDASRPVLFGGCGFAGSGLVGHSFVADGYDSNDFIHFNWGWGGLYDGFFQISTLNPGGVDLTSGQTAVIGIEPSSNLNPTSFSLYSSITVNPNPINYGQTVTVNADIINNGSTTFYGEIAAFLFDKNYNFVKSIQTLSESNGFAPNYHYTNGNNFVSAGLNALPGKYYIGIYVKPTDGNWIQVDNGSYQNLIPITIVTSNTIKMNSPIIVTPETIIRNQVATIKLDVSNSGTAVFNGNISVNLHNLDGTWIQTIDGKGLSMPVNSHFTNGLTFNTSGLDVSPGSYLIAVWAIENGGDWKLVEAGSDWPNQTNPIKITISQTPLQSDPYEPNDIETNAYNLSPLFSGNVATLTTEGSNIDIKSDIDCYKVILPAGYNYTITPRIHDSYNSGNGNKYTLDGLFSYSTDGSTWSGNYDDITLGNIKLDGGGTIRFRVVPYYKWSETGTYLLDMSLTRTSTLNIDSNQISDNIKVYPNPANSYIEIKGLESAANLSIYNLLGQEVLTRAILPNDTVAISSLSQGVYIVKVNNQQGAFETKLIKE